MPFLDVLNVLKADAGSHFDQKIVDAFFEISVDKILNVLISANEFTLNEEEIDFFCKYKINDLYTVMTKEEAKRTREEKKLLENFEIYYFVDEDSIIRL